MFNKLNLGKMRENEYYFVQKSNKKEYFPCRVIKLHNSWAEVENLETEKKEDLIFIHHKTEIDIRFQNRFQKINTFIEEKAREEFNLIKDGEEVDILKKE